MKRWARRDLGWFVARKSAGTDSLAREKSWREGTTRDAWVRYLYLNN